MAFTNSPLAQVVLLSKNHSGQRQHEIDTITIHCYVGQVTAQQGCNYFANTDREVSSNYVVGKDGSIGLSVEEKNRSWCSSSRDNDHRAVTIEVACDTFEPHAVTDKAYEALINLVTDICKRNNIKELKWKGDKSLIGQIDKQNMTVHRWFSSTACPGAYLYERHGQIAAEVNERLGVQKPTETTPPAVFNKGDIVKIKDGVKTYADGMGIASWVRDTELYVRGVNADNSIIVSIYPSGAITGTVFAHDLILVESMTKTDDKPSEENLTDKPAGADGVGSKADEETPESSEKEQNNDDQETHYPTTDDDCVSNSSTNTPTVEDSKAEIDKTLEHTQPTEKASSFIIKILKRIINYIIQLFKNKKES